MPSPLAVCSLLVDTDVFTNCIFMNPKDAQQRVPPSKIVLINGYPFTVVATPAIQEGHVGMNSIQRRFLNFSVTMGSLVSPSNPPACIPVISKMSVMVEYSSPSKKGGTLDYKNFTTHFLTQFGGQCFRKSQRLAVMNSGMLLCATVTELSLDADGEIGSLSSTTKIRVVVHERSEINLVNVSDDQLDSQQEQLMRNFNLENLGIGGLRNEFAQVFRRAFASRLFPLSHLKKLGIKHVKGVLLHGPPGTGKTLIARKIGEILNCHAPKIVNGPEVFDKYVGGTEENIRKLFLDAEMEATQKGDLSRLHLIIFDEFDAICKQRGAVQSSTGVNDNVVNQLLSKIDGVNSLNNVLLIGMTNRIDLIDDAILRPGRFEVHVEIGLPSEDGREEIFRIHTRGMSENGALGKDVDFHELAELTKNYSGAEIEGVVRSATSNAFNKHIDINLLSEIKVVDDFSVGRDDFFAAIEEVKPAFGQAREECSNLKRGGIIHYGEPWSVVVDRCNRYVQQLNGEGKRINSLAVLVEGVSGCGKSAVAAYLAEKANFPYVRVISSEDMVGYGELQKVNIIRKAFEDAYKSPASIIILDDLERIIEFSQLGGRYSNAILQALLVLIKRQPLEGRKLLVVGTTALYDVLDSLEMVSCFSVKLQLPSVPLQALRHISQELGIHFASEADAQKCTDLFPAIMPIKQFLVVLEMAAEKGAFDKPVITSSSFAQALESVGIHCN